MGITFIPGLLLYTGSFSGILQYIFVILVSFVIGFGLVHIEAKPIREELNA